MVCSRAFQLIAYDSPNLVDQVLLAFILPIKYVKEILPQGLFFPARAAQNALSSLCRSPKWSASMLYPHCSCLSSNASHSEMASLNTPVKLAPSLPTYHSVTLLYFSIVVTQNYLVMFISPLSQTCPHTTTTTTTNDSNYRSCFQLNCFAITITSF